jgi:hypothetical protein
MEDVLLFVLKQSPLVVFMSIVVWQQQKEKNAIRKDLNAANKAYTKERKETNESNIKAMAELVAQARESDMENIKVLEAIKTYMIKNK